MKKIICLLLVVCCVFLICCGKDEVDPSDGFIVEQITKSEMKKDLNAVVNTLKKYHKNLYHSVTEKELEDKVNLIEDNINNDKYTSESFAFELMKLCAFIGDGATRAYLDSSRSVNQYIFPFFARHFEDGVYLYGIASGNSSYLGYRISHINDIEIENVFKALAPYYGYNTLSSHNNLITNSLNNYDMLKDAGIAKDDTISLLLVGQNDERKTLTLKAVKRSDFSSNGFDYETEGNYETKYDSTKYYFYKMIEGSLYIQYNISYSDPDNSITNFISTFKAEFASQTINNIFVDLRYNSGGDKNVISAIIQTINSVKAGNCPVYCIIGRNTSGTAILNAMRMKNECKAIIVGSPTGGSINYYSNLERFVVPNSRITFTIPEGYIEEVTNIGLGPLEPSILIHETHESWKSGTDRVLQELLKTK